MRPVEEKTFQTHDGVDLFYRYWPAVSPTPKGAILLFHRGHEHSGRMAHLADELDLPDFAVFAWDARGQGRSPGERGFSPSLGTSVRDVQTFVEHIVTTYGIAAKDVAIVAQSVGAVLVSAWAHDYAPNIRCMVLASPAFKVKLRHMLPGFYHDTFGERYRALAVDMARRFILERFAEPTVHPSLLASDRAGFTRDEADALASPLPLLSPRGLFWAAARMNIAVGARLSDGIRLGRRTGFDSGSTLDYVYRNTPAGCGPLGRVIDTIYLQSIGWRGIRQRKAHL